MRTSEHLVVTSRGDDIGVFVSTTGDGGIALTAFNGGGDTVSVPRLTPEESRRLAEMLTKAAEVSDLQ